MCCAACACEASTSSSSGGENSEHICTAIKIAPNSSQVARAEGVCAERCSERSELDEEEKSIRTRITAEFLGHSSPAHETPCPIPSQHHRERVGNLNPHPALFSSREHRHAALRTNQHMRPARIFVRWSVSLAAFW